jgi:lysyl-tRNA synthetase, class II
LTPLASSNLAGYDYDPDTQTLQIRFKSGRTYSYSSVPQSVADGLGTTDSPGQYFNSTIKDVYAQG